MQYGILLISIIVAALFVAMVWQNVPPKRPCHGRNCKPTQMNLNIPKENFEPVEEKPENTRYN
jgi:hypothetical protein